MEVIAHRYGNTVDALTEVEGSVDLIEVDIHLGRNGRLEVRHAKSLWPTKRLWEKWYLLPTDTPVPLLEDILAAAQPETKLWLDLKGPDPRLATKVIAAIGPGRQFTVSTKAWWLLKPFAELAGARTVRSAGNRFELALLKWLPTRVKVDGSVLHRRLIDDGTASSLLRRGLLFTWAVRDIESIQWLGRAGISGVILDDLSLADHR